MGKVRRQLRDAYRSPGFAPAPVLGPVGTLSPNPLGFFAFLSNPQEAGLGSQGRPSLRYSSPPRRSGCFPAEPYPPGGHQGLYHHRAFSQTHGVSIGRRAEVSLILRETIRPAADVVRFL
jgi:hypothetical protein